MRHPGKLAALLDGGFPELLFKAVQIAQDKRIRLDGWGAEVRGFFQQHRGDDGAPPGSDQRECFDIGRQSLLDQRGVLTIQELFESLVQIEVEPSFHLSGLKEAYATDWKALKAAQ